MRKIKLTDRSSEIFDLLPKEYAEIIINSVIAKSVSNGTLFEEVSLFLTSEKFSQFRQNFKDKTSFSIKEVRDRAKEETFVEKKETKEEKREKAAGDVFTM